MLSTTTFNVGDLIIVASAASMRAPCLYMPNAIGAPQLAHTPSGVPSKAPASVAENRWLTKRSISSRSKRNQAHHQNGDHQAERHVLLVGMDPIQEGDYDVPARGIGHRGRDLDS
jgi:hypothetical protein